MALFPVYWSFICEHSNLSQAVIWMFKCLSLDKEEIIVLFPIQRVTSAETGLAQNILKGFIPKLK